MNRGVAVALAAYLAWGFSPIYWRLVDDVATGDVIVFRVLTTILFLAFLQALRGTLPSLRKVGADPAIRRAMIISAVLLASNWVVFVWSVTSDRVLQASLGYFINPLVSVVLGVVVLHERLHRAQWLAVGLAGVGVIVLSIDLGEPPWVSLLLALTFGLYGLIRKTAAVESLDGLSLEMVVLLPVAIAAAVARAAMGDGTVGWNVPWRDLWLLGAGVVTATPLLLFTYAARRIPLSLIGVLQYLAPTIQFLLGVIAYDEAWSGGQMAGYVLVWIGLIVFAMEGLRRAAGGRATPAAQNPSSG